jgi:HK97 family phage major capsid protein
MIISDLVAKRKRVVKELLDLADKNEGGSWTQADRDHFDALSADSERLRRQIEAQRALEAGELVEPVRFGEESRIRGPVHTEMGGSLEMGASYFEKRRAEGWSQPWHVDVEELRFGDFLRATVTGPRNEMEKRALSEGTPSGGGYAVPEPVSARIIDALRNELVLARAGARIVPLESDVLNIARLDADPSVVWTAENALISSTQATFGRVQITPYKLAGLCQASRELLQDASNVGSLLERAYVNSMARSIESAILVGASTSGGPTGVYESTSITAQSVNGSTVARITWDDVADGRQTLSAANVPTGQLSLISSPRTFKHLSVQKSTGGGDWMGRPNLLDRLGIYETAAIADNLTVGATTNVSWAALGSFPSLMIGLRLDPVVEILKERYADYYQYGFLAAARIGAGWEHDEAVIRITNLST